MWDPRFSIALQLAQALRYLHEGAPRPVLHRNVRSASVLISRELNCVVSADEHQGSGFASESKQGVERRRATHRVPVCTQGDILSWSAKTLLV